MSLVVQPEPWEAPEWFEGTAAGIPVVGSLVSTGTSLGSGDWGGALASGVGAVGDLVGIAVDPFGTLASSVAGFLLDRFAWFQEALDVLVGDPAIVTAVGLTWANAGATLVTQAERLITLRDRTTEYWQGPAAEAFRRRMTEMAQRASAEAFACRCVNTGFAIGSGIVVVVREIITAILAELVGRVIAWAVEALSSLGVALPAVVGQAVVAIQRWVSEATKWTDRLLSSAGQFSDLLQKMFRSFDEIGLYNAGIGPHTVIGAGIKGTSQVVETSGAGA